MRVGLDVTLLENPVAATGNRPYILNLVRHLSDLPNVHLVLIGGRAALRQFNGPIYSGLEQVEIGAGGGRVRRTLGTHLWLPRAARRSRIDLLHSPSPILPLLGYSLRGMPTVATVMDLRYREQPTDYSRFQRLYKRLVDGPSVRSATRVIAISEFTKQRAIDQLGIRPDKITVTWLAADPAFAPRIDEQVLAHYGLGSGYLLAVGNLRHKRADLAIRALAHLSSAGLRMELAVLGTTGRGPQNLQRIAAMVGVSDRVHFLGYVPDSHLPAIYSASNALIFPSSYEGFGIPLVEAMSCGTPVVASGVSAVREVLGPAGVVIENPTPELLAGAVRQLADHPRYREGVIRAGLDRARQFSWATTARATAAVYAAALGSCTIGD